MNENDTNIYLPQFRREQRVRSWLAILAWVAWIYTVAFVAVPFSDYLNQNADLKFLTALLFAFVLFFFIMSLFRRAGMHKTRTFVLTLSAVIAFALNFFTSTELPCKQYHLIEYSVLSYLLYNALSRDVQGIRAWFLALLLATLVGLGDEALQLFVPGRFASLKDILVDLRGVAFGLMFAAIAEIEKKLLALGSGRMS